MPRAQSARKPVIGLDIEPGYITAAEVKVDGGIAVSRAAFTALPPGVVRDGEVVDADTLSASLRDLFRANRLDRKVRVGVASARIVVRVMDLPPLKDRKELDTAVRFQAQEQVPMPLDQAVLDWQSLGMVETGEGTRTRVVLVAARREMIDRLLGAIRRAGLRPEGIDLSAFAMIRALLPTAGVENQGIVYINAGGLTNIAVADGPVCLFTRVATSGVESIVAHLAERRELTLEHARQWLVHVGLEAPVHDVDGDPQIVADARAVLSDGVRRIADDVRNSLEFYGTQENARPVERAILTGPAASIPGVCEELGRLLGMPIQSASVPELRPGALAGIDGPRLTVAAGLAIAEAPGA